MGYVPQTVTVNPSGDMARKEYYDRNMDVVSYYYSQPLAAHSVTIRWIYTVPANHKAQHSILYEDVSTKIATAGKTGSSSHVANISAGGYKKFAGATLFSTTDHIVTSTITAVFYLKDGDSVAGRTYSNDTVSHGISVASIFVEFDE